MTNLTPLLLCDFYKTTHSEQYPQGTEKLVSYFTPRMSRIQDENHLIMFGLQSFLKEYLIDIFNRNFFHRPVAEVVAEYTRMLDNTMGSGAYKIDKIVALHALGYLPLEINALPEGTRVPVQVPMIEISNTHPEFPWLVNSIETLMSCSLWHPMISANVGYTYRKIVDEFYAQSVEETVERSMALGDFSMRGQESLESAIRSSAAFCLSFMKTASVPAIHFLEEYYNCNIESGDVAVGGISTEHSVMCSNFSIDGDEITMLRRLLNEIYPHHSFSMVADSYDYWHFIDTILPKCKQDVLNHDGVLYIRGDSGDPVEIVTETVFRLWDTFGGQTNAKGYKVLDPHIRAIYGDSITPQRARAIYKRLIEQGFSCENVSLGVGSFSMQCVETDGVMQPFTRDTFGIAVKSTYGVVNGREIMIEKKPITDTGNFKKSQKGMCHVFLENGELKVKDGYIETSLPKKDSAYKNVFKDGVLYNEQSLHDIRQRLHKGGF
ncbi:nicotinate phosphoribosyltransferase [Erysipelothrix sp. HDW6C]|uniref:nicotinate phosphoribosyltransferase n=1 Tax=Erysipelothrix sp. HDW6C TaxID=2714930 RepID=UPI00140AC971|nr:nicotinate phosphoribosyltransferase [Erysipelothrix sp. HDW6C]QIK70100.1 nicotinate phosphoribosyltransferase [Erysipelothrix sp. HDW6C]